MGAVEEATALIHRGTQNRKIGQTKMNQQSSRSHSVFTCCIESTVRSESGITNLRFSRLNLVDLAGGGPRLLWQIVATFVQGTARF